MKSHTSLQVIPHALVSMEIQFFRPWAKNALAKALVPWRNRVPGMNKLFEVEGLWLDREWNDREVRQPRSEAKDSLGNQS